MDEFVNKGVQIIRILQAIRAHINSFVVEGAKPLNVPENIPPLGPFLSKQVKEKLLAKLVALLVCQFVCFVHLHHQYAAIPTSIKNISAAQKAI
jgi:hypothetical protein